MCVAILLGFACVVATVAGCSEQGYHGLWLENRTDVTVDVIADGAPLYAQLLPGTDIPLGGFPDTDRTGNSCRVMTLVARDQQHREVARQESKVCPDDRWVITASAAPS